MEIKLNLMYCSMGYGLHRTKGMSIGVYIVFRRSMGIYVLKECTIETNGMQLRRKTIRRKRGRCEVLWGKYYEAM